MFKKLNKKGFTLAELLVVVAIIGVLVAISIPIFTSQLEKSRDAVTVANLRSAYALLRLARSVAYLAFSSCDVKIGILIATKTPMMATSSSGSTMGTLLWNRIALKSLAYSNKRSDEVGSQ